VSRTKDHLGEERGRRAWSGFGEGPGLGLNLEKKASRREGRRAHEATCSQNKKNAGQESGSSLSVEGQGREGSCREEQALENAVCVYRVGPFGPGTARLLKRGIEGVISY